MIPLLIYLRLMSMNKLHHVVAQTSQTLNLSVKKTKNKTFSVVIFQGNPKPVLFTTHSPLPCRSLQQKDSVRITLFDTHRLTTRRFRHFQILRHISRSINKHSAGAELKISGFFTLWNLRHNHTGL